MRRLISTLIYFLFPPIKKYRRFMKSQTSEVSFYQWCKFWLSRDKRTYWPVHKNTELTHPDKIFVGINSKVGIRPGNYIQGNGGLYVGNYVTITPNCGVITGNHNPLNHNVHINKEVRIDDYCWIGMNVMIMPGVHLGPRTIVGAGSVVTKSFPEGYCVIGGNPAKLIKELDKERFVPTKHKEEYYGFVPKEEFPSFADKHLKNNKYINEIEKISLQEKE